MPANVSLAARASVTAGFANDVDDVNQYAAVMYAPTANGTTPGRLRADPQITARSPNVATNSPTHCPIPVRSWRDAENKGSPNITCAIATPTNAPASCATTYAGTSRHGVPPCAASESVTAGLKCAPEI